MNEVSFKGKSEEKPAKSDTNLRGKDRCHLLIKNVDRFFLTNCKYFHRYIIDFKSLIRITIFCIIYYNVFFLEICKGVVNNCIIQPLDCEAIWNKLYICLKNKTYKVDNSGRLGNSPVGSCWISLYLRFLLVKNLKRKKDLFTNVTWLVTFKGSVFRNLTFLSLWCNFLRKWSN